MRRTCRPEKTDGLRFWRTRVRDVEATRLGGRTEPGGERGSRGLRDLMDAASGRPRQMKAEPSTTPLPTMWWDGAVIIAYDLPKPDTIYRWTPKRKALFVRAIRQGLISREHFLVAYSVSGKELDQLLHTIKNG